MIQKLLENNVDVNFPSNSPPLHLACQLLIEDIKYQIVYLLIKYGANVNKLDGDLDTPMTVAT